jgi:DNA-binding PadR family transcriptional regulator
MPSTPTSDARSLLPLKPLVFQVLLALSEGERHGWSLVREIQQRTGGERILPANFYRTLRGMLADGLIADSGVRGAEADSDPADERRRYFQLTPLGQHAARFEARRLQELVADSRTKRLLSARR